MSGAYNYTHINILLSVTNNYLVKIILFKLYFYFTNLIYKKLNVLNCHDLFVLYVLIWFIGLYMYKINFNEHIINSINHNYGTRSKQRCNISVLNFNTVFGLIRPSVFNE